MRGRLAVYGLLRRGERLAHLLDGARFVATASLPGYDLCDLGAYPGAVPGEGVLVAEIYELASDAQLALLDEAEGVHEDPPLYRRVALDDRTWIYLYARPTLSATRIASGDWRDARPPNAPPS